MINTGTKVIINSFLPYEETTKVYDIKTKEETYLPTGKIINCIRRGNYLFVSQSLYDAIKKEL